MFQHIQLFLDWLASPMGSNLCWAILSLATLLGMHLKIVAGLSVALFLLLAFW